MLRSGGVLLRLQQNFEQGFRSVIHSSRNSISPDITVRLIVKQSLSTTTGARKIRPQVRDIGRTSSLSLRKRLHFFFKLVHPDVLQQHSVSTVVRDTNADSLGRLNDYIDELEASVSNPCTQQSDITGRILSNGLKTRTLQFFVVSHNHRESSASSDTAVEPITVALPPLATNAPILEKFCIQDTLVKSIRGALVRSGNVVDGSDEASDFCPLPQEVPDAAPVTKPIFTPKDATRRRLQELWRENIDEGIVSSSTLPTLGSRTALATIELEARAREIFLNEFRLRLQTTLKHAARQSGGRTRMKVIYARLSKMAEKKAQQYKQKSAARLKLNTAAATAALKERQDEIRLTKMGFFPHFIMIDAASLSDADVRIARHRIAGRHLNSDADHWLLRNIWKSLREGSVKVPIVVKSRAVISGAGRGDNEDDTSTMLDSPAALQSDRDHPQASPLGKKKDFSEIPLSGRVYRRDLTDVTSPAAEAEGMSASLHREPETSQKSHTAQAGQLGLSQRQRDSLGAWRQRGFGLGLQMGSIEIAPDFDVWALADFLEEFLGVARSARTKAIAGFNSKHKISNAKLQVLNYCKKTATTNRCTTSQRT